MGEGEEEGGEFGTENRIKLNLTIIDMGWERDNGSHISSSLDLTSYLSCGTAE